MSKVDIQFVQDGIGERLKEERTKAKITQHQLAKKLNMVPLTISNYENGKSIPSLTFIYKCNDFKMDIVYIIFGLRLDDLKRSGLTMPPIKKEPNDKDTYKIDQKSIEKIQQAILSMREATPVFNKILRENKKNKKKES